MPIPAALEEFAVAAIVDEEECESCVDEYYQEAAAMGDDEITAIDADRWIECGRCIDICPSGAMGPGG